MKYKYSRKEILETIISGSSLQMTDVMKKIIIHDLLATIPKKKECLCVDGGEHHDSDINKSKEEYSQRIMMEQVPKEVKLRIGDKVKVINNGEVYTTFYHEAIKLKAKNWEEGNDCENGDIGIINNIDNDMMIALIDINDKEILIGKKGLQLIPKQDKPVCEHKKEKCNWGSNNNCYKFGGKCTGIKSPPEDTNKTSLVPEKISLIRWRIMTPEARQRHLWGKQCELIEYLTLISLDKK